MTVQIAKKDITFQKVEKQIMAFLVMKKQKEKLVLLIKGKTMDILEKNIQRKN